MAGYNVVKTQRALPIGSVQPWGGSLSEIPKGWLLCNFAEINAGDYPLLARVIRDTYGGTDFAGDFPNYSGTIRLPPTNDKALADISTGYFGTYNALTGIIPGPMDNAEALAVVSQYIGDSALGLEPGDLGPPNVVNAKTDIDFVYNPDPQGTIVNLVFTGSAPAVTQAQIYQDIPVVAGTNIQDGSAVVGLNATFTVVINADGTYDIAPKNKGSQYKVGDQLTILGNNFQNDGGVAPVNNIAITITQIGSSEFEGTITGQSFIEGFSIEEVFIVARKLGRNHFPGHFHEGTYETINVGDAGDQPGRGCCIWNSPDVNVVEFYERVHPCPSGYFSLTNPCPKPTALDCTGGVSTAYYVGNSPDNVIDDWDGGPFETGVGRYAIASVGGSKPIADHRPYATSSTGHGVAKTWFAGSGAHWNLRDKTGSTSASGDANLTALKQTGRFFPGYRIPFSDISTTVKMPNFDAGTGGSDDQHGFTKTLFNHAGVDFTNDTPTGGGIQDRINPHDHDGTFTVRYDGSNMDVPAQIQASVQPNIIPDQLPGALQITFTTRVPSLSVTNLIRAY